MESNAAYDKPAARAEAIARRNAIPTDERAARSRTLSERLLAELGPRLPAGATLAAYAALGSEVDLAVFLHGAYGRAWRVALPCMMKGEPSPRMVFLQVERAAFDAYEAPFLAKPARALPADDPALAGFPRVAPAELDAVLVPMVAFDDRLCRLGYGGGNYDRLLSTLRPDALVVGVAFEEQRIPAVPLEPHDLPLPRIMRA